MFRGHLSTSAVGYVKQGQWALVLGGSHGLGEADTDADGHIASDGMPVAEL